MVVATDADLLAHKLASAPDDLRQHIADLLAQHEDDQAWAGQIGPVYHQTDVAALLGKSKQAVSADPRLVKLIMRSGRVGYPVFQFRGQVPLEGLGEIVTILTPAVATHWTIASWLTSPQPQLAARRPLDELRRDNIDGVATAARAAAAAMRR